MRIKRLKINRFRNVRAGCELRFSDKTNIILGLNGTGKSTLLALVASLLADKFEDIGKGEDYDVEAEFAHKQWTIQVSSIYKAQSPNEPLLKFHELMKKDNRELAHDKSTNVKAEVSITSSNEKTIIRYDGTATIEYTIISNGKTVASGSVVRIQGSVDVSILLTYALVVASIYEEKAKGLKLSKEYMKLPLHVTASRFEEGLEALEHLTKNAKWIFSNHGSNFSVQTRGTASTAVTSGLHRKFSEDVAATTLAVNHTVSPALRRFTEIAHFPKATFQVELIEKTAPARSTPEAEETVYTFGNARIYLTRKDKSVCTHELLSRGQKRLLAFLLYLEAHEDIAIVDELVNDLHYEWIEQCLKALPPRQALLTSQNPLLLDQLIFEDLEDVKGTFVLCYCNENRTSDEMTWRNLSDEEAHLFYRAYEAGVQHVSEILRSKRLW